MRRSWRMGRSPEGVLRGGSLPAVGDPLGDDAQVFRLALRRSVPSKVMVSTAKPDDAVAGRLVMSKLGQAVRVEPVIGYAWSYFLSIAY